MKDIYELEKVQRRATRLLLSIKNMDYNTRLKLLNLSSLEDRRKRGDPIQIFKILNGFEVVNFRNESNLTRNKVYNLRRHNRCMVKENVKNCMQRYYFLTNRVVNMWNSLPQSVVDAKSVNSFKARLDEWISKQC